MMPGDSPCQSKKRIRDNASDSTHFPPQKRVNHNEDQPQGIANNHAHSADFAGTTTRSLSPDGGVAIDEETLAKFRSHVVLSCDDDTSDNSSHSGSDYGHQSRGRSARVTKPFNSREEYSQAQARRQILLNDQHNLNDKNRTSALPYASSLPVFNHQRGSYVVESGSSTPIYQPFRGLQSAQPLDSVTLNPRIGMAVEGGKLYLAQTLHHYYRKHIHCPHHGPVDGRPGHNRAARKVHETGTLYRVWFCTSQPKGEGHRIDNADYIKLAIAQLD
ncbi:hypothetical protein KCU65_g8051, partial [Aureobasidium melanogenum]